MNIQNFEFDTKLPKDPDSSCNKFIIKGYSFFICIFNIILKLSLMIVMCGLMVNQIKNSNYFQNLNKYLHQNENATNKVIK